MSSRWRPSGSGCTLPSGASAECGISTQMMGSGRAIPFAIPFSMLAEMVRSERTGSTASAGSFWRSGSLRGRCVRSQLAERRTMGESCCPPKLLGSSRLQMSSGCSYLLVRAARCSASMFRNATD